MAEEVGQEIKDVLINGQDENGENRTVLLTTGGNELNYIPERVMIAGKDTETGNLYIIKCNTDGKIIY